MSGSPWGPPVSERRARTAFRRAVRSSGSSGVGSAPSCSVIPALRDPMSFLCGLQPIQYSRRARPQHLDW
ncbi:hypothetical protein ACFFX0_08765 [Citricoccus parietis]|uniref:Uncharacterized protein n=1 Tax=Citricoccus parietis TaxID=592307 RepID=A0ABV5FX77_9MICC